MTLGEVAVADGDLSLTKFPLKSNKIIFHATNRAQLRVGIPWNVLKVRYPSEWIKNFRQNPARLRRRDSLGR